MIKEKKQFAYMEDMMPLLKETLANDQNVIFMPRGRSMLPLLREGRDRVILSPVKEPPKPYDIILYQRADEKYVLHRIVAVDRRGSYVCMGDNQLTKEYGVKVENIIAVVSGFYRGKRAYGVDGSLYQLYCCTWYHGRRAIRLLRRMTGKFWRK